MNEEDVMRLAQQIMADRPGMSPQEAIATARDIVSGQADRPPAGPPAGINPYQPGPSYGTLPSDVPRAGPGMFGPGGFQPQGPQVSQPPQRPPVGVEQLCAASGGTLSGGMCHYNTPF
jgi:hypothetical protein